MIQKKFLKTKCKVTFSVPETIEEAAQNISLVGDFNNWDSQATPMDKKSGKFAVTVDLDLNREYEYRYLINGHDWFNDKEADRYAPNPFSSDNSVVLTYANTSSN
ncbi:MAG TPA: isoamylase early set domain-containing protein [Aggregatilineales bacterium]|nr:isoamylase early set domain-containing protein [Aggregatilineales bacterium]